MEETRRTPVGVGTNPPIRAPSQILEESWHTLEWPERVEQFRALPHAEAEEFFLARDDHDMYRLLAGLPARERRGFMRALPPDDAADVVQQAPEAEREGLLALLEDRNRHEVIALMLYAQDAAGGLMNPRFSSLRPEMEVDEAITYLRRRARAELETTYYVYVLDDVGAPVGVVSLRGLFAARPGARVRDVMRTSVWTVPADMDQEKVAQIFTKSGLLALPVVDEKGRMKGLVAIADIVDVVRDEATEDIQKFGGMDALDAPYLEVRFTEMVRKRAGWLAVLLLGEMLTTTAMMWFQVEISKILILTVFIPLIISSGGNSGSQASTLVIQAFARDELRLSDWWRVARREINAGLALGACLGVIGFIRVIVWQGLFHTYGEHATSLALTVALSLVGVVLFGTLSGSTLPFMLRRVGLDPASASAPFVATLVDVTGLLIYFTVASLLFTF